jgi:hypothetical protein
MAEDSFALEDPVGNREDVPAALGLQPAKRLRHSSTNFSCLRIQEQVV